MKLDDLHSPRKRKIDSLSQASNTHPERPWPQDDWLRSVILSGKVSRIGQHIALIIHKLVKDAGGQPIRISWRELARISGWGRTVISDAMREINQFIQVHQTQNGSGKAIVEIIDLDDKPIPTWYDQPPPADANAHRLKLLEAIRHNPIVGVGFGGDPDGSKYGMSRSDAFVWIISNPEVTWSGSANAPCVTLLSGRSIKQNPVPVWQWTPKFARKFINAMAAHGLIDDALYRNLIECTVGIQRNRSRAFMSPSVRSVILDKTSGKCVYCAVVLTIEPGHRHSYCVDHVLAVANGGSDDIANLVPSCQSCNNRKSAKTALQFLGQLQGGAR